MAVEPAVAYQVLGLPFGAPCPEVRKVIIAVISQERKEEDMINTMHD